MIDFNIFQSVFNNSPDGEFLFSANPSLTILAVNNRGLEAVSRERDDVVGKPLFEAFPGNPEDPQDTGTLALHQSLIKVIATGKPDRLPVQRYPIPVQMPDGSVGYEERFWSVSNTPIFDNDGKLICISHRTVDVTQRERAEAARKEYIARQTFQLQLADRIRPLTAPDEVTAAASELLGRFLNAERVFYGEVDDSEEFLDLTRDWADGSMASMAGMRLVLDEFGPQVIDIVRGGRTISVDDVTTNEHCASYADAFLAKGVRSFIAIPLLKDGRLKSILSVHDSEVHYWNNTEVAMAEDMVDRTWSALESARAQSNLRYERDQSQYIFDNMLEGFAVLDRHWTILRMNAEGLRLTRCRASEVIGRSHWDVWPYLKGTKSEVVYRRVMETGKTEIIENVHVLPDNTRSWMEVRVHRSLDGGIAFFFRDITDRKLSEEKLQDTDRRKDEFLAMLAHELRNPLAPIRAAAELLQLVKIDEARVRQTSQIIDRQVRHMTSLVDDLLDVSRVTRGLIELERARIDINHVVADAIEQVTPLIRSRRHRLGVQLTPEPPLVMGDRKRLVQVIVNLLTNSAKYTREGGQILLKTEVRNQHVLIQVTDNGIGMTPDLVSRAFDLFAQGERTSDRSSGGLGLGLALVKSLIELHHGMVACESPGVGRGSTFTVCLPRLSGQDQEESVQQAHPAMPNNSSPLRILVVDDNTDAASMLGMLLEASGYQVLIEHGSHRALERVKSDPPQVCILDIGLAEMDGYELAKRLRASPQTADALLIAVTGYGQASDRQQALAAGFDHHLVKPVDIRQLLTILAEVSYF
ncbi:PAS domain-containing protein [Massilia jejuensis]|uniref:histidine kinase n=1 Tax=Massilia jejuensis TaxID=648894 RepID=A0ABW0PJ14_9BURK